ncbi:MAG: Na+/H+ antiporter NhaA [Micavibrio aeruginosavorus]|uniref:Na(+)/H(+) antiporter NhaA n=1 Tax=Micavibrio aeruginosavorus TaxID=349221 RepID=A0A2W5A1F3_9BACT|nr:MAG: Na+/H+ antiporter NhaA [Micavibrio aeruginosavorus]
MTSENPHYFSHFFTRLSPRRIIDTTAEFLRLEAAGGIVLVIMAVLALIIANSPLYPMYNHILNGVDFSVGFADHEGHVFGLQKTVLHWINDGLMAVFFLLVGLEIKRELVVGELSSRAKAVLPIVAAIGGIAAPAIIYAFINRENPVAASGWAIPTATDIAFALGVLSLLGSRVPVSLKILLTAVAIIDDLAAIMIIALFYSEGLHVNAMLFALIPLAGLFLLNRMGAARRAPYILLGILLWMAVLKSGVHATMAGVITALFIPLKAADPDERRSPAMRLENDLHPWVAFLILPVFAFANAGVPFEGISFSSLLDPLTLGIILGLFLGKQAGVFGAMWLAIKTGLCPKPEGTHWSQLYGVSILCGIGFTMSLFIGGLAFTGLEQQAEVRLGVLAGSFISAIAGYILLRITTGAGKNV